MKNPLTRLYEWARKRLRSWGYGCDCCGRELFDYPVHRLCEQCEKQLERVKNPCPKCGRESRAEGLCLSCKSAPPAFTRGASPFVYSNKGASLINRLKNGEARFACYLGERMGEAFLRFAAEEEAWTAVAVPLTEDKRIDRGFNQSELLAENAVEYLRANGVRAETDFTLLVKKRETKPQKRMTKRERASNVRGAFAVTDRKRCAGKAFILVDDVCTTGATASECARKLLKAKAKAVYFLSATSLREVSKSHKSTSTVNSSVGIANDLEEDIL